MNWLIIEGDHPVLIRSIVVKGSSGFETPPDLKRSSAVPELAPTDML